MKIFFIVGLLKGTDFLTTFEIEEDNLDAICEKKLTKVFEPRS